MPLILFTIVDNNGLSTLIGGCLLSNEQFESYTWALLQFRNCTRLDPLVVFSDGDTELARAIVEVWPRSVHLLCRFHIAQNINRKLAAVLRSDLNLFLDDFWRVGAIEDMEEYHCEFNKLQSRWNIAGAYLNELKRKQEKWAFAYTHRHFVAGISSTQRQEMINYQVKCSLISNYTLSNIIDGFERVEKNTVSKLILASLNDKMVTLSADPMIDDALQSLTAYAGSLLRTESSISLSYECHICPDENLKFRLNHRDKPEKFRIVTLDLEKWEESVCTCRKMVWHGIVCRHILCAFRHTNRLSCPVNMFNQRWHRDFSSTRRQETLVNYVMQAPTPSPTVTEDDRAGELAALSKTLILRSLGRETTFNMVKSALESLIVTIARSEELIQTSQDNDPIDVRNPLRVKTKGRPKTGQKRYKSRVE